MCYHLRLKFPYRIILFSLFFEILSPLQAFSLVKEPSLEQIILNGDSVTLIPEGLSDRDAFFRNRLSIQYRLNNIAFQLTPSDTLQYQYFLSGFDHKWSSWKKLNYKEYTNLPVGYYTFQARYRSSDNNTGELTALSFKVIPLWYFSHLAFLLYIICFILIACSLYLQLDLRFATRQYALEQIINKRTEDLTIEKEKTETLLANVLPKNTASEIMAKGKASKKTYNFVTVLFSDIQGFTNIAEEMNPEVLIDELDKFFFHFDSVVEKYGIEKIKTIGDAYMCAGGIPEKNRTNPVEVILAALEMKSYMENLKKTSDIEGMKNWDIRIGIHTGTVIAGVVGQKKLSYDIWGDTVNTASRMESSGEAGKINISGTTYELVSDFFICEFRGKMPVKYKGEVEMYFVEGIVPDLLDEHGGPNRKFIIKMQLIKLQDIEEMIIRKFDDEAPSNLYFHNSSLVRRICRQVEVLSAEEKLPQEELINVKLAAVFLLTGFISDYEKPMEASIRLAEEILPRYGFNTDNIESTSSIIKNSYANKYKSLSDKIMHDARYDYLGRADYFVLTGKLLRERTEYGKPADNKTWYEIQNTLLNDHQFLTGTARVLRNVSAEVQMATLHVYNE
jgi:adenylate cyclase